MDEDRASQAHRFQRRKTETFIEAGIDEKGGVR